MSSQFGRPKVPPAYRGIKGKAKKEEPRDDFKPPEEKPKWKLKKVTVGFPPKLEAELVKE